MVKYGATRRVSEMARRLSPMDELQRAEEKMLSELIMKVHHDRRQFMYWPKVERIPLRWDGGKLIELGPDERYEATEWQVSASVMTCER